MKYIGETSRKLNERIIQHRSDIKNNSQTPVANHFNQGHFNLDHLKCKENYIWSLTREEVITLSVGYSMTNNYHLLDREHHWITLLKTLTPNGLNLRTEAKAVHYL